MKYLIITVIIISSLASCSKETEEVVKESCNGEVAIESISFPQTWKLIKMTANMMNSETTGIDMYWQESIQLKANGTFIKIREQNGQTWEVSGSFSLNRNNDNVIELTLTYPTTNNLVGSCYGNTEEKYLLTTKCKLVGTWQYCDGPGLEYERQ